MTNFAVGFECDSSDSVTMGFEQSDRLAVQTTAFEAKQTLILDLRT
jgi:hypothetical protein